MTKKYLFLFIVILVVACSKKSTDALPETINTSSNWLGTSVQVYTGPEIPRLAWGSIPQAFISAQRYNELKEAGITHNVNWYTSSADATQTELDIAQNAGVKLILNCVETTTNPEGVATRFKSHPALGGYYIGDEPKSDLFAAYGATASRIRAVDNTHFCYVNLPRITHSDPYFGKGTTNYIEYINDFLAKINPEFISYDNYTVYYPKDDPGLVVDPSMYENLEVIRNAALSANKDFWAFCLTSSHSVGSGLNYRLYPDPLIGHMRFYVYSDLAYGAQGIEYFTYWQAGASTVPNQWGDLFLSGPISFEGVKGPIYDRLKTINTEIKNLSFVFADAKVKWVRHTGSTVPRGTTKLTTELGSTPFTKLQATGGLIVSLLEKDGTNYLVLVNRDPAKPIDLTIETGTAVKRVLKSGALIDPEGKLKITEGDVAIYKW